MDVEICQGGKHGGKKHQYIIFQKGECPLCKALQSIMNLNFAASQLKPFLDSFLEFRVGLE